MNEGTSKFLLDWINANASTDTELVKDIKDPSCKSLLLNILYLVDKGTGKDLPCDRDFDLVQVLSLVISYLGGFHRQNFTTVITDEKIRNKDELEIGKVITLLLCAATQCDNVATFVSQITKLSIEDQFHFKFLIESVLTEMEEGSLTAESFENILKKQVDLSLGENHNVNGSISSPITVQSPVEALFTNSPLKSLVASPQLRSRQNQLMLNKLQQKVIKLQATLDSQMHLQSDLETELTEKNKEIDARDSSILQLRKEVTKLMSAADELELMRHFKEECSKAEKENARLKQKVVELQTFKQQCGDLEGKMADFMQEREQFEKEQVEAERFKSSIERYKTKVHQMEFKTSELEAALSRKERVVQKLEKEMEEAVSSASKSAEMMREIPRLHSVEVDDVLLEGLTEDALSNLDASKAPLNMDSRIIELEFEKDRLTSRLSTCVNQEEFLALKETLAYSQETQSSYKENYIAAKSKILELEEKLAKIKAETRVSHQNLDTSKEQHDLIKEELARTILVKNQLEKTVQAARNQLSAEQKKRSKVETEMASLKVDHAAAKAEIQDQLQNVQEHCFQEVEQLKAALVTERSEKAELCKDLELKDKRLQQTAFEIEALTSLKEGLEGSLQTCSARAHDDKVKYDKEMESKKQELEGLNKQRKDLEEGLVEKTNQIRTLEQERNQIHDAYEQILLEMKKELDSKMESMRQDKAATLEQFRLRTKQLEEDHDKMKEEFAERQKLMLEEETKNAAKLQEACDAEHAAWKKKFNQLSQQAMDTRSEMLENLKKHSDEMMEVRKAAREREDKLDEDVRRMREKGIGLESQLLNAENAIAELQHRLKDAEVVTKELEEEREKLAESQKTCESYALKAKTLEASVEQLRKEAESDKESLRHQMQEQLNKRDCEIDLTRQKLENLKKDYNELEQRQTGEMAKVIVAEKDKCQGLFQKIRELETTNEEKGEEIENLMALLKTSVEEKENAVSTLASSRVDWDNKEQQLLKKVEELEGTISTMTETRNALAELEGKLEEETLINRRLGTEINSLEAQLCCADQQIRKQRQEFESKSKADSARRKTIAGIKSQLYHGPLEEDISNESDESLPLQLEDFSGSSKEPFNTEHLSLLNESSQSLGASCHSLCSSNFRAGVQTRASRRQSAIYLRGNTPPERRTTNSAAYFILGGGLGTETEHDDEVEYDWNRLAELQRRNASCLPHLQTSYPVETQMQPELSGETNILKTDRVPMDAPTMKPYNIRKRKSEDKATSVSISKPSSSQTLAKSKSAPNVTPGKRISSRRIAEAMQSALGSRRSRSNENLSSTNQDSNISARRESIAYNIDISPPKKTKANIARRRTIARYTGSSHLLGEKNKVPTKKTGNKILKISVSQERKPLKNRQL